MLLDIMVYVLIVTFYVFLVVITIHSVYNNIFPSAMLREQNNGLRLELGGHQFKPRINRTSQELAATMKVTSS
jgi:hypothetical protein